MKTCEKKTEANVRPLIPSQLQIALTHTALNPKGRGSVHTFSGKYSIHNVLCRCPKILRWVNETVLFPKRGECASLYTVGQSFTRRSELETKLGVPVQLQIVVKQCTNMIEEVEAVSATSFYMIKIHKIDRFFFFKEDKCTLQTQQRLWS